MSESRAAHVLSANGQVAVLSLTFDDGPVTAYTDALPCMQNRSLPATVYCISNNVGSNGALTRAQILDLQDNYGWEIGSHTKNHIDLLGKNVDVVEDQVSGAYNTLTALGARIYGLAYPFGRYDSNAIAIVEKYHVYGRAGQDTFCQNLASTSYDESSRYRLLCSTWDKKNLSQVENEIDMCVANKSWLIGVNHGINGQNQLNCTTWNELMDYVKAKVDAGQLLVKTVFDAVECYREKEDRISERFLFLDSDRRNLDFRRDVFVGDTFTVTGMNISNLLENSGFEDARYENPVLPQCWYNDTLSGTASLVTSVVHSGAYCLLLNRTISTGNVIIHTSDQDGTKRIALPATAGKTYTLSVWVNTNTTSAKADLAFFNGSRWIRSSTGTAGSVVGWQKVVISYPCPSNADGVSVYLYIYPSSTGWAYFDDVMLSDTDLSAPYVAGTTAAQTTDPNFKIGVNWYNYSGTLMDAQNTSYQIQTLLGGQVECKAQIAGSRVAVAGLAGKRVLYVDKAWVKLIDNMILFDRLFDNTSIKAVIYRNFEIQFISGVTYDLSASNAEGGTFYFAETANHYAFNASEPFVSYCTDNIVQESFNDGKLILTMNAPSGKGSATICTGNRGKPDDVRGATNWSYDDSTGILTVNFAYPNGQTVEVYWTASHTSSDQTLVSFIIVGISACTIASIIIIRKSKRRRKAINGEYT